MDETKRMVIENLPVASLPDGIREQSQTTAFVTLTVEARPEKTASRSISEILEATRHLRVLRDDPVKRIRALRKQQS